MLWQGCLIIVVWNRTLTCYKLRDVATRKSRHDGACSQRDLPRIVDGPKNNVKCKQQQCALIHKVETVGPVQQTCRWLIILPSFYRLDQCERPLENKHLPFFERLYGLTMDMRAAPCRQELVVFERLHCMNIDVIWLLQYKCKWNHDDYLFCHHWPPSALLSNRKKWKWKFHSCFL